MTQELFLLAYEECYDEEIIPVDYQTIEAEQRRDRRLLVQCNDPALKMLFQQKELGIYKLWVKRSKHDSNERIYVPKNLQTKLLD